MSSTARNTPPCTGVLPAREGDLADVEALFLALSPRASVRVDTRSPGGEWRHSYVERELSRTARPPRGPYAVYLTDDRHRFQWVCFDLDGKRGDVGPDLATLLGWLDEAGLSCVVAASGSEGGRHVWVTSATPLDAVLVRSINEAACKRLPTLDKCVLNNPATGGVRPIGAPHRNGGRSTLISPTARDVLARRLTPATCGNTDQAFVRLLRVVDAHAAPAPDPVRLRPARGDRAQILDDEAGPRLAGTPNTVLDEDTYAMLTRRPPEDRVSETLASLLTRLALRRWTWPMVVRLLSDRRHREGGLLHACTGARRPGLRRVLTDDEARRKLRRQWERCLDYAASLPLTMDSAEWTERIGDVLTVVAAVQAAADADPERWARESGPADRAALDLVCLLALRSGSLTLALDVRRAAIATGHGRSTMHRALTRLRLDGQLGTGEDDGGAAATYTLLSPSGSAAPSPEGGGTQGPPPPEGGRGSLMARLQTRLATGQSDVFAYGRPGLGYAGGLGHHAGRTYQQLTEHADRTHNLADLSARTGYSPRTCAKHLQRLQELMIVGRAVMTVHHECPTCQAAPGQRCRTAVRRRARDQHTARQNLAEARTGTPYYRARPGSLTAAAKALRSHGRLAARARLYAAEQELYHWWQAEEARMRAPKTGVRTGPRVHLDQGELIITTLPKQPHRRYPRTPDGRGDHTAARARIARRLTTTA